MSKYYSTLMKVYLIGIQRGTNHGCQHRSHYQLLMCIAKDL